MKSWFRYGKPFALTAAIAVAFGACNEQLDGGDACPVLCPRPGETIRDTTFFAIDVDTTVERFPSLGAEQQFYLASFGDTLQTRAIVRYDSLPTTFTHAGSAVDSTITFVDTGSVVKLSIVTGDTLGIPTTIELYDVDFGGDDDVDPTLPAAGFTPDRLMGSRTVPADSLKDTVSVPIDNVKLLNKIIAPAPGNRLRIGIRVTAPGGASQKMVANTVNAGAGALLIFRPSPDSTVPLDTVGPFSKTPSEAAIANNLADYLLVTSPPPATPAGVVRVGGIPGTRVYYRFSIPASILDSSNVVRATLLLTQRPNGFSPTPFDTTSIEPVGVLAGNTVTDLQKALLFIAQTGVDSARLVAADSGLRSIEMVRVLKLWTNTDPIRTPRALALRSTTEGVSGKQIDFYSIEAPEALRPRLRVTYMPKPTTGIP